MSRVTACIYCGRPAGSREHIIATRFIDVLREDPRGLPVPIRLTITSPSGSPRTVIGKRLRPRRRYTLEYTTRVCASCNSGWMNAVDDAAFPHLAKMIRGHGLTLDQATRSAIAAWVCKVAVTARSAPHTAEPIEKPWTDWLYTNHSALPGWYVWVGRFIGSAPFAFYPHNVRIELGPCSAPAPPGFVRSNGVLATLVIGYLITQVFGVGGPGALGNPDGEVALPLIWPLALAPDRSWPTTGHLDDASLPQWAQRLLHPPK